LAAEGNPPHSNSVRKDSHMNKKDSFFECHSGFLGVLTLVFGILALVACFYMLKLPQYARAVFTGVSTPASAARSATDDVFVSVVRKGSSDKGDVIEIDLTVTVSVSQRLESGISLGRNPFKFSVYDAATGRKIHLAKTNVDWGAAAYANIAGKTRIKAGNSMTFDLTVGVVRDERAVRDHQVDVAVTELSFAEGSDSAAPKLAKKLPEPVSATMAGSTQ
jgi:hypothetical protein